MKLVSFSVTNYRSITTAHKIPLSNLTVLIGKNNEGKSNFLMALNTAMAAILNKSHSSKIPSQGRFSSEIYSWERDFPVQLRERKSGLESSFRLDFRLEGEELEVFHSQLGIHGNEDIPIRIRIGRDNEPKFEIRKKGTPAYNRKATLIADFISDRISFNYIQAVRTENMAMAALLKVVREELYRLVVDKEYNDALQKIAALQQEALNNISSSLLDPLKVFLPALKNIRIIKNDLASYQRVLSNDIDIYIDDGVETSISYKGDGIKSLVALAILKERKSTKDASIIAIEEPESHLHSGAIHSLVEVINKISENNQVIISTHNPLFVQRNNIKSNIIVNDGLAYQAKNIAEIREILGVLVSDNLRNAENLIVVEGEDDVIALSKLLPLISTKINSAIQSNSLVFWPLNGASNLSSTLSQLRSDVCKYAVLLDNDSAGRDAADKALRKNLLTEANLKFTICNGSPESEFEDCLNPKTYRDAIFATFGVDINCAGFRGNKKWSERMKETFLSQGNQWNDEVKQKVKFVVAESVPADLSAALIPQKSGFIYGFAAIIENML